MEGKNAETGWNLFFSLLGHGLRGYGLSRIYRGALPTSDSIIKKLIESANGMSR